MLLPLQAVATTSACPSCAETCIELSLRVLGNSVVRHFCTKCGKGTGLENILIRENMMSPGQAVNTQDRVAVKKHVTKREKAVAALLGGRTQPNSGAMPGAKGDMRAVGQFRGEHKSTFNKSFSLKLETLQKIWREASVNETPVLVVEFLDRLTGKPIQSYAVVALQDWARAGGLEP